MVNFVLCFLNEDVQPLAEIRCNHVHEAEAGEHLMAGHIQLRGVQKDELHLYNGQDHASNRCKSYVDA